MWMQFFVMNIFSAIFKKLEAEGKYIINGCITLGQHINTQM
jgi:hypothetical protein